MDSADTHNSLGSDHGANTNPRMTPDSPHPPSGNNARLRREKPQLSCNACRSRKVRCDRKHPCGTCSVRGLGSSCTFAEFNPPRVPPRPRQRGGASLGPLQDRINELEGLVRSLMHQQQLDASPTASDSHAPPPRESEPASRHVPDPSRLGQEEDTQSDAGVPVPAQVAPTRLTGRRTSPTPSSRSSYGSTAVHKSGAGYVSSAHWTALLDSIAGLREHLDDGEAEEEPSVQHEAQPQTPLLFYSYHLGSTTASSPSSIIESIPSRPVVDRLVTLYFNEIDIATGVVHRAKFLRQYEEFWTCPEAVPISWLGLLLALMCLSSQFQKTIIAPATASPSSSASSDTWRSNVVRCLILSNYTKGGANVVETLVLYLIMETQSLHGEVNTGIWLLVGTIVNIAVSMGMHRDAEKSPDMSAFDGEIRRRIWAFLFQVDVGISTQIGKPRHIKPEQTDTQWPRNLLDSDFDEDSAQLPPSRPETDVTPILYTIAKLRILSVGARGADLACSVRPSSYNEALQMARDVDSARAALPLALRWPGSGASSLLNMTPLSIINGIWLELGAQKLKMLMHAPFVAPPTAHEGLDARQLAHSRSVCLDAATGILDLHHFVDEEMQPDGRLFRVRWRMSRAIKHEFLLATGVLCYYLHHHGSMQQDQRDDMVDAEVGPVDVERIKRLLRVSLAIWQRESSFSRESRNAVAAVRYVLGDDEVEPGAPHTENSPPSADDFPQGLVWPSGPAQPRQSANQMETDLPDWMPGYDFPYLGLDGFSFTLPGPKTSPSLDSTGVDTGNGTDGWTQMDFSA